MGLGKNRFASADRGIVDAFLCIICHHIMLNPFMTQCCQRLLCKECCKSADLCQGCSEPLNGNVPKMAPISIQDAIKNLFVTYVLKEEGCNVLIPCTEEALQAHNKTCRPRLRNVAALRATGSGPSSFEPTLERIFLPHTHVTNPVRNTEEMTSLQSWLYNKPLIRITNWSMVSFHFNPAESSEILTNAGCSQQNIVTVLQSTELALSNNYFADKSGLALILLDCRKIGSRFVYISKEDNPSFRGLGEGILLKTTVDFGDCLSCES